MDKRFCFNELPQLINVLKGEMSFIGPRPWVPEYFETFTEEQKSLTPGQSVVFYRGDVCIGGGIIA